MEEKDHLSVTGDSDSNTITLDVSGYGAAQPAYIYDDMSGTNIDLSGIDTITLPQNTLNGAVDLGSFTISNGGTGMQWTTNQWSAGNTVHAATVTTAKGNVVDIDELADLIKVLKQRLLILAPNFEMHEKYPMLKELYDEYKAMEKLLSGPDRGFDEE